MQKEYRFYGRRQGRKLSPNKKTAIDNLLPKYEISNNFLAQNSNIDPVDFFDFTPKEIWLEIGFGGGEHLAKQALNNPDIGVIGCEPFINGISRLLTEIEDKNIKNIRIWSEDARIIMNKIKANTISRCFLLHPDPWPKKKHHKRRFIQEETLDMFANLMIKGSELRIATDDSNLADWMLDKIWHHKNFKWLAKKANDWKIRPKDWPETRYGQKQLAGKPVYLRFKKI